MTKKAQTFTRFPVAAVATMLLGMALAPTPAHAQADPLIEGARQCTQYFPVEEQKNGIPTHLLAAIATTESGRWHKALGMNVPWPWTINVEGKGYVFNSKAEAIAQTQSLIAKGYRSIDVGCMQVNLKHHPKAFADLNQAFDPSTNVAYAAKFLHDNYATLGDWIKATAAYHSRTPVHGARYLSDIERSWNRIVAKVASARASKGGEAATMALAGNAPTAPAAAPMTRVVAPARVMAEPRKSRVIEVHDAARSSSEVVVVRPAPAAPVVAVADAAPAVMASDTAPKLAGDSVRRVSLDNSRAGAVPKAGPQFVFAN
ncbi:MAG: lytic transglycosylase domain-containing protein [Pseudomonadota bacterium]